MTVVSTCELCEAARFTPWYYEDDVCWVAECEACTTYIEQMRMTITALGHIPPETISSEAERELLDAFRDWRAES